MLQDTKRDLTRVARKLAKPYETYSIDELADAYCEAVDTGNSVLKDVYISALILRFWYVIDKLYASNTTVAELEREDFFNWLYESIEYACKYRAWKDPDKKLNAQQCINKCIDTIKLQKYYVFRLDKHKASNNTISLDAPINDSDGESKSLADLLECEDNIEDTSAYDAELLIQSYINKNKIIEAIILDNIAFNDTQKHFKEVIKAKTAEGEDYKYTDYSSEFWPYRLVQIVSQLPDHYKPEFLNKYEISEEKLTAALEAIDRANNQKIYKYLRRTLEELRRAFA